MPKDEFTHDDPLELVGIGVPAEENTMEDMAACFIEEFVQMGYPDAYILNLFRSPAFAGAHMVYQQKGEDYVRNLIAQVRCRYGACFVVTAKETTNAPGA